MNHVGKSVDNSKMHIGLERDFSKCSGCRKCEIACSLFHENRIWPEASRVRVFMLVPGTEFPHLCTQCEAPQCISACPTKALSVNQETGAVAVDNEACTGCGQCIKECPSKVPHLHPAENRIVICDLCSGDPQCAKVCVEGGWEALKTVPRQKLPPKLCVQAPEEVARELATKLYGKKGATFL